MPLSEHEQRLLEQMEKALYAEDPKFATSLQSRGGAASRSRAALGVLAILGGLGIVLAGMAVPLAILGVAAIKDHPISMRRSKSCSKALRVCLVVGAVRAGPEKAACLVRCLA